MARIFLFSFLFSNSVSTLTYFIIRVKEHLSVARYSSLVTAVLTLFLIQDRTISLYFIYR